MRAGLKRHRVTIEEPTYTESATSGEPVQSWTPFVDLPCSMEPVRGDERFVAAADLANVTHLMRCSYYPGITPEMRASWTVDGTTRTFRIQAVLDYRELHRDLILTLEEEVPARAS